MKYTEWEEKYKPVKNHLSEYENLMFETYGDEVEYVKSVDPLRVWTLLDGEGVHGIYSGLHWVNRLGYYITEVAREDDSDIEIILSTEEECGCYDEDTCEGKEDCEDCEGSGWKIIYAE